MTTRKAKPAEKPPEKKAKPAREPKPAALGTRGGLPAQDARDIARALDGLQAASGMLALARPAQARQRAAEERAARQAVLKAVGKLAARLAAGPARKAE